MKNIKYMDFPKIEYEDYIKRMNAQQKIYTTRVSEEVGKYVVNEICNSPFGRLKIISLEHFEKLEDHPFLKELTDDHISVLNDFIHEKGYDLIGLVKL